MNKKVIVSIVAVIAIVALLGVFLVACNADSYKSKLEKKGYTVSTYTPDDDESDDIEWGIMASKGAGILGGDYVIIVKYKNLDDAKEAEAEANKSKTTGYECSRQGKIVFAGTTQGVKDAK